MDELARFLLCARAKGTSMLKARVLSVSVATIVLIAAGQQAKATTITFDAPISNLAGTFNALPLGIDYLPNPSPNITATTQGYNFGGVGSRPDGTDGQPDLVVVHDPTQCPAFFGTAQPCVSDGTHYATTDRGISLMQSSGGFFSLNSFDASGPYG